MTILVSNTFAFEKEVVRLNKKAAKIGVPAIRFTNLGQKTVTRTVVTNYDGDISERTVPVSVTEYDLVLPELEDRRWELMASITPVEDEKHKAFVDSRVKGFDGTPWQNGDPCRCDHCRSKRHRSLTYVVRNKDDNRLLQLGRNCFADYVGTDHLAKMEFRSVLSVVFGEGDEDFCFPGSSRQLEVIEVRYTVAVAEAIAEVTGWKNNQHDDMGNMTTEGTHRKAATYVKNKTLEGVESALGRIMKLKDSSDPIWDRVDAAIARIQEMGFSEEEDFGRTLATCAEFTMVPKQKASLVAYLCQFLRNHDRRAELEAKKATMIHVGTVGKRETFAGLTCKKVITFDSIYGTTHIHIFADSDGNELVWKTGRGEINEGETVTLKATVKEHGERNGAKQTIITRAKVA